MAEIERWSPFKVWLYSLLGRNPQSNIAAIDRLALGFDDRFLDIGCGLGAALEHAAKAGAETAGIDPSPSMVERAGRRVPSAEVKVASAEAIPFPDDHFTAVSAVGTFHHWADRDQGLGEVLRVLAPGGRLLIVERHLKRGSGHGLAGSGASDLLGVLRRIGFESVEIGDMKGHWARLVTITGTKPYQPVLA